MFRKNSKYSMMTLSVCCKAFFDFYFYFKMFHQEMKKNLRNREHSMILKSKVANLAHSYISAHHPTTQDVRKHRILRNLKNNNGIIVLRPDKGNGVVIMDRNEYIDCCLTIINGREKFKCLHKDPTQIREGKLQRFF